MSRVSAKFLVVLFVLQIGVAVANAQVRVLCAVSLRPVLEELSESFERQTGQKIIATYDTSPGLKRRVESGAQFDVAVLAPNVADDLIAKNQLSSASRTAIARTSIGVAAREGISYSLATPSEFKSMVGQAKSIATSDPALGGAAAVHFQHLIERFGIADQVRPKLVLTKGGEAPQAVANGQAEIAIALTSEIVPTPGVVLAGSLPEEIQRYVTLIAATSSASRVVAPSEALIAFLRSPSARKVLAAKGMEPGS